MKKFALFLFLALSPFAACASSEEESGVGDAGVDAGRPDTLNVDTGAVDSGSDSSKKDAGKDSGPKDSAPIDPDPDTGAPEDCPNTTAYALLAIASTKDCAAGCDPTECCVRNPISSAADRCVLKLP